MDDERYIGELRKYEKIGGLCLLAILLLGWLPWHSGYLTNLLFGTDHQVRAELIVNLMIDALCLLTLLPLLRRYLLEQVQLLVESGWDTLKQLLLGLLLAVFIILFMRPILYLVIIGSDYSNQNQNDLELLFSGYPVWTWVIICIAGPLINELLFRGVIFCGLYLHSRRLAYLLSSLAYAFPYVSRNLLQAPADVTAAYFLLYFLLGLNLARTYERSGNLFSAILLNAGCNLFAALCAI